MTIHIIRSNINPLELIIETAGFTRIVLTVHGQAEEVRGGVGRKGGGQLARQGLYTTHPLSANQDKSNIFHPGEVKIAYPPS